MTNAIVSVNDKEGVEKLVSELQKLGWNVYATSGTADYLEGKGLKVRRLSELTGIVERRWLKTLHPEVFERIFSRFFELVVVDLYEDEIDVGGSALVRAGVKAGATVVCRKERYDEIIEKLKSNGIDEDYKIELAIEALECLREHDARMIEKLRKKIRNTRKI